MADTARWRELQDLMEQVPVDDDAKDRLLAEMSRPARRYHGVGHLATLWARHRLYAAEAGLDGKEANVLLACAIAYHDSVYDVHRVDNEERSAEAWLRESANSPIGEAERRWVAGTISATKDHFAYRANPTPAGEKAAARERARLWMLDLDLTPLGETRDVFDENTRRLREEFAHVADDEWRESMKDFRRHVLAAPRIYRSETLAKRFEAAARDNFSRPLGG
jgi:predicted metal-dependent HD superfamily phosphohydrolase